MNYKNLEELLQLIKDIPDSGKRDRILQLCLNTAADSIDEGVLLKLIGQDKDRKLNGVAANLKFSEKEYLKMPLQFRKVFRHQGCVVRVYRRESSEGVYNYELRYRRDGYDVYASANDFEVAKQKFIERLKEADKLGPRPKKTPGIPNTIDGFANYYFENFYKRKVTAETLRVSLNQYKNHISPHFNNAPLRKITPKACQELLDSLEAQGKGKTLDDVFTILNIIFKAAVKHNLLQYNPLDMVFHTKHAQQHGSALTKKEEKQLLTSTAGTPQQLMFAIALYTGMRPNEYKTAIIEGDFIVANNSKRKNGKVELKKIPITPMLKPYLNGITELHFVRLEQMRNKIKTVLPTHKLYDLRTTFYTRCQECGVAEVAIKKFVGHTLGGLADTYTDLPDEFLLKEGAKFTY